MLKHAKIIVSCQLMLLSTGSLVKKLKRSSLKLLSSHIFLYEAVVISIVCDYLKALLGATSRAFCNGSSIIIYVENCFIALMGHEERLPCCY
ncbi:NOF-FB transposable element protein [Aphis craccivora]|uniref:NOF-FB transposable element protein n=1 Tax=Aphis craccivora TaxID=307492 RepID=A0A6G0VP95_APHCR|nr:NOF-FB transposable element protein [Aphis craccivora]